MAEPQLRILPDQPALIEAAADFILETALAAITANDRFTIALTGGSMPRPVYELLASSPRRERMPWDRAYFFWSDDRAVPLDDDHSNYKLAWDAMLSRVPAPKENIQPMLCNGDDLDAAAQHYARVVRSFVPGTPPRFDLVLLGMGPDGHCASLFPHSPQLAATDELVVATPVAPLDPPVRRMTFTKTLINAAANVVFLVGGANKADRVQQVIEGPRDPEQLPSQLVAPTDGTLTWLLDQAAASKLMRQ